MTVPAILTGAVDRPGDVDLFQIRVQPGARLAFEFETPKAHPPRFNPWLKVRDAEGHELITNIFQEYGGDGTVAQSTERRDIRRTQERLCLPLREPVAGADALRFRALHAADAGRQLRCKQAVIGGLRG